jgi:GTPase Era involved in 16S rRNA processing
MMAAGGGLTDLLVRLAGCVDGSRADQVVDLQGRWASARLRILLVGEAKRGKSTLGNAILGRDVLPTGVIPLTAVATTVRLGDSERVEVHQLDGTVTHAPLAELERYVTENGNPGNERGVAEVVVHLAGGLPHPSAELVDTPGIGSIHQHNTDTAEGAMERMDVAVFVLTADPPISAAEQALLTRVRERSARTYIVLNKIDQLDPQDRVEAEQFTRQAIADHLRLPAADVDVFCVSARTAVRAGAGDDTVGAWEASGMAAFNQNLHDQLERSWQTDLTVSISATARRLVAELLDESALAHRARELLSCEQADRIAEFARCLDGLDSDRQDAIAVATAYLARWQAVLDDEAATVTLSLKDAVHHQLEIRLSALVGVSNAELEATGWTTLNDLVVAAVSEWQQRWSARLAEAAREASDRQQQLLDAALAEVRSAAASLLDVDLSAPAERLALPSMGNFRFDITSDVGWNEPVVSALRRRFPGAAGRARMHRHLHSEASRLVDKHIGRARADFQARMEQFVRDLRISATRAYTLRQSQLRHAISLAGERSAQPPIQAADEHSLEIMADQLDALLTPPRSPAR